MFSKLKVEIKNKILILNLDRCNTIGILGDPSFIIIILINQLLHWAIIYFLIYRKP